MSSDNGLALANSSFCFEHSARKPIKKVLLPTLTNNTGLQMQSTATIEKNETLPSAATQMGSENTTLSEISQRERLILYDTIICGTQKTVPMILYTK